MRRTLGWVAMCSLLLAFAVARADAATVSPAEPLPWSMPGPGHVDLQGISCPTANRCVTVGDIAGQRSAPLVATYVNGNWRSTVLSIPPGGAYASLTDVSCPTPTWCAATGVNYVDQYQRVPFTAVLSGSEWSEAVVPLPEGGAGIQLNGISCPVPGTCVAAGEYIDSSSRRVGLVEALNNGVWTIAELPPTQNGRAYLTGVDCSAASACIAVGAANDRRTVVDTLSARGWNSASLPRPDGSIAVRPAGISCAAAASCTFVGLYTDAAYDEHPFAETLAAGAWTRTPLPQPPDDTVQEFADISCPDSTHCVAIGAGYAGPFVATMSGTSWTAESLPVPSYDTSVSSVSCRSATTCLAVGWRVSYPTNLGVLDVLTSGVWSTTAFALPGAPEARLHGVSCVAANDCLAMGIAAGANSHPHVMTETSGSSGWTSASLPPFAGVYPLAVYGISCPVDGTCVAIVRAIVHGSDSLVAYTRDAGTWHTPQLLVPIDAAYHVSAPTCPAIGSCTAVASYLIDSEVRNVAMVLADGGWTITDLPVPPGGQHPFLLAVSCASAQSCVTTGNFEDGTSNALYADVLAHGLWTATVVPAPAHASAPVLTAISCATPTWCMAVGRDSDQAFVAKYSRGSWTGRGLALPTGSSMQALASVSCTAAGACTAVGADTDSGTGDQRPLVDTFADRTWQSTILTDPATGTDAALTSVSCVADRQCVGVGSYTGWDGGEHPFAVNQT